MDLSELEVGTVSLPSEAADNPLLGWAGREAGSSNLVSVGMKSLGAVTHGSYSRHGG